MNPVAKLYVLCDPRDEKNVRYVGWTAKTPGTRLRQHINEARGGKKNHRCNWIRSLMGDGILPKIRVVAVCSFDEADAAEIDLISGMRTLGYNLVNGTDGGAIRGWKHSPEIRKKISQNQRPRDGGWKAKQRAAHLGGHRPPISEETREKMAAAQTKRYSDPIQRLIDSASQLGLKRSPYKRQQKFDQGGQLP